MNLRIDFINEMKMTTDSYVGSQVPNGTICFARQPSGSKQYGTIFVSELVPGK